MNKKYIVRLTDEDRAICEATINSVAAKFRWKGVSRAQGGKLKPDTVRNILRREVLAPLALQFPTTFEGPGIVAGRLHSFRHYFCSLSAQNRVPEMVLMSWLDHQDAKMIRHYYHQSEEGRIHMNAIPFLGTAGNASKPTSVNESEA